MSEMVIGKKTGVPALRARRPAPKLRPKNKEDNKMVSSNNELVEDDYEIKESIDLDSFKPSESKSIISLLLLLELITFLLSCIFLIMILFHPVYKPFTIHYFFLLS